MNARVVAILLAILALVVQAQNTNELETRLNNDTNELETRLNNEIQATKNQAAKVAQNIGKVWSDYTQNSDRIVKQINDANAQNDKLHDDIALLKEKISELEFQVASEQQMLDNTESLLKSINLGLPDSRAKTAQVFDANGQVHNATIRQFGPVAIAVADALAGQAFIDANSSLPIVPSAKDPEQFQAAFAPSGSIIELELDITGKHPELHSGESPFLHHLKLGGIIMIPILLLGVISTIIAIAKLIQNTIHSQAKASQKLIIFAGENQELPHDQLEAKLTAIAQGELDRRQKWLSWLAITTSAAPLLGLLGTVTGMIHTFQVITQHGVGDAKILAGGISEALITTEAGLCVAIPALMLHALLVRSAKHMEASLESTIDSLVNTAQNNE
jgi:biopolymer transport protein ExbB